MKDFSKIFCLTMDGKKQRKKNPRSLVFYVVVNNPRMLKIGLGDPDLDLGRDLYLHKCLTTPQERTFRRLLPPFALAGVLKGPAGGGGVRANYQIPNQTCVDTNYFI